MITRTDSHGCKTQTMIPAHAPSHPTQHEVRKMPAHVPVPSALSAVLCRCRDISHAETLDRLRGAITKLAEQETAAAKALEKAQGFLDSHRFHIEHTQNELEMERANREDFKQQAEQVRIRVVSLGLLLQFVAALNWAPGTS